LKEAAAAIKVENYAKRLSRPISPRNNVKSRFKAGFKIHGG
jgi:hypothetical protein